MIYTAIYSIALVLGMALLGVEYWGTFPWWKGFVAAAALALVWYSNRTATTLLSLIGVGMLAATAFGLIPDLASDGRAFFNGASIGMLAGLLANAWWRWKTFRPRLVAIARAENAQWLLNALGERDK